MKDGAWLPGAAKPQLSRIAQRGDKAGPKNKYFQWVDPLGVAVYRRWLLSVNRNNNERVVVDRASAA